MNTTVIYIAQQVGNAYRGEVLDAQLPALASVGGRPYVAAREG